MSIEVEEHLLYKMYKLYGVEANSASLEMVTCTREWTAFSLELWPVLHAGCDGVGVFQMTGALLKMKAQTVLLQAACTD